MEQMMNSSRTSINRMIAGIVAALVIGTMTLIPTMSTRAQHVSLTSEMSTETLATVSVVEGERLMLLRFTLEPGASIRAHSHSGPALFTVVSGALQVELIRGAATVNRGNVEEPAEVGTMTYLYDGESITFAPNAGKIVANDSAEPLVLIASILLGSNEPVFDYDYWSPPSRPNLQ
jgi:mannose-6-phosphate isomerase-like protein (cupin superfamily)